MIMTSFLALGLSAHRGLASPAAELIEDGWTTAPIGISAGVGEQLGDLAPAPRGLVPMQVEGLGNRLPRDGKLQGQAPGMRGGRFVREKQYPFGVWPPQGGAAVHASTGRHVRRHQ
jgi:hypothetical protein